MFDGAKLIAPTLTEAPSRIEIAGSLAPPVAEGRFPGTREWVDSNAGCVLYKPAWTALHVAAQSGHINVLPELACLPNYDLNYLDEQGKSPIAYLLEHESIKQETGWLFESMTAKQQRLAFELGSPKTIRWLATHGRLLAFDSARSGDLQTLKLLVENGARLRDWEHWAKTPLHAAIAAGHDEVVFLLLKHGADPNYGNQSRCLSNSYLEEYCPLYIAIANKHLKIAEALLAHGANPNVGYTPIGPRSPPLHLAVKNSDLAMVSLLIAKGARTDLVDENGRTPLQLAASQPDNRIVRALRQAQRYPACASREGASLWRTLRLWFHRLSHGYKADR